MSDYPPALQAIVELCESLPEPERREMLITYAENSANCAPAEGEEFDLEDIRKDEECTDTVGIHLNVDEQDAATFKVSLGPKVQTLTRAMTSILCKGLNGAKLDEIMATPDEFVPRVIGAELVRLRSQTVYYVLSRMKGAVKVFLDRRAKAVA